MTYPYLATMKHHPTSGNFGIIEPGWFQRQHLIVKELPSGLLLTGDVMIVTKEMVTPVVMDITNT